jgi:hypothetical protein
MCRAALAGGVAPLILLPLDIGDQIEHCSGLLSAEVVVESRAWLGVFDADDDLGVVPHALPSATRTSVGGVLSAILVFGLLCHGLYADDICRRDRSEQNC